MGLTELLGIGAEIERHLGQAVPGSAVHALLTIARELLDSKLASLDPVKPPAAPDGAPSSPLETSHG